MNNKLNLSSVRLLNRLFSISLIFMYIGVVAGILLLGYGKIKDKKDDFSFVLDVPFYFSIDEKTDLVKFTDKENNIGIKDAVGKLSIKNPPSWYFWVFLVGINLLKSAVIIAILLLLQKITKNIIDSESFHRSNSIYLKIIGILLIAYSLFISLFKLISSNWFANQITTSFDRATKFELDFNLVLTGLFAIALGAIFNYGSELQKENDLTV
ncbi:MAG: DUF2975 domain-containing protein [Bacteroidales bacterium]